MHCEKECICERINRAEQRVRDEIAADGPWFRSVVHKCCEDKQTAYAAGLDAAREAVAAALAKGLATSTDGALYFFELSGDSDFPNNGYYVTFRKDSLIAAIDALREKT
jgi:hypothetical protein